MREKLLTSAKRIVIKIGSGVISTNTGLDGPIIDAISSDICALIREGYEVTLVSSGAISAGKQDSLHQRQTSLHSPQTGGCGHRPKPAHALLQKGIPQRGLQGRAGIADTRGSG